MNKNMGNVDRGLRVIVGLIVLSLFFFLGEDLRWWALLGIVPVVTGLSGFCPLYTVLGIRTCKSPTA